MHSLPKYLLTFGVGVIRAFKDDLDIYDDFKEFTGYWGV